MRSPRRRFVLMIYFTGSLLVACSSSESGRSATPDSSDATVVDAAHDAVPDAVDVLATDTVAHDVGVGDRGILDADGDDMDATVVCSVSGALGQCILVSACAAWTDHTSYAGYCSGPADIECCITTPSTAANPPVPAGYQLMSQSQVTPAMTAWAVAILNDPATYPMFATATMVFGSLTVLARVEWHPPDFQNSVVHRGVTLYEPT